MATALTADELYPQALTALSELMRGLDDAETLASFERSLRDWSERRDVRHHLRQNVARMGSMVDWVIDNQWHNLTKNALLSVSRKAAELIEAGQGRERVTGAKHRPSSADDTERCARCGFEFVRRWTLQSNAAEAWQYVVGHGVYEGRASAIAAQALDYANDPECRAYEAEVLRVLRDFGVVVLDDSFRNPVFDEDAVEPPRILRPIDDRCPGCGANEWREDWIRLWWAPVRVDRTKNPFLDLTPGVLRDLS